LLVPGVIGCLQALEAIKVATAVGKPLCGRMLHFDALSSHTRIVKISRSSPTCKVCGENPVFTKEDFVNFDYESFTQSPMSKNVWIALFVGFLDCIIGYLCMAI
jgi:adenylyltransferase/sulfurtransferase